MGNCGHHDRMTGKIIKVSKGDCSLTWGLNHSGLTFLTYKKFNFVTDYKSGRLRVRELEFIYIQ
jgi:hypothetical protein